MRVAAIADIHANITALRAVLSDIKTAGVQQIICLGDLVGYGPFPDETVQVIRQEVKACVQGNYDAAVGYDRLVCGCDYASEQDAATGTASMAWTKDHTSAESKEYLRSLPPALFQEVAGYSLHCFHGSPQSQTEYIKANTSRERLSEITRESTGDILLFGHTHLPGMIKHDGKLLINAGSVGKPKHGDPRASYVLLDFSEAFSLQIRYVSYDVERTASDMRNAGLPDSLIRKIQRGTP